MARAGSWGLAFVAALCVGAAAVAGARAQTSPADLAAAIERRANASSFADLRRFADDAMRGSNREALRRLNYAATVFRNQAETDLFRRYNDALARNAAAQHDQRYAAVAELNRLIGRYDQGDSGGVGVFEAEGRTASDWFVRVYAQVDWAEVLVDRQQPGEALKTLTQAELLIPKDDGDAEAAEADVWEMIGIAMLRLDDLEGAVRAFQRSQIEFAEPAWPRPDFDTVYNLGHLAILLGDRASAAKFVAAHHRLTLRSDLPHLAAWDANLCGMFAEAFGSPAQVLACLHGLGPRLKGAELLAPRLLPMRSVAEARTGRLAAARADLAWLEALGRKNGMAAGAYSRLYSRIPQVRAELLRAEGHPDEAYDLLRDDQRNEELRRGQEVYGGVRQLTRALETELATARHDMALEAGAVRAERLIIALVLLLSAGIAGVMVMLARGTRRLKAAHRRAEAANAAKSVFLATMSHEIRTPMNGVLGMAQAMQEDELSPVQRERLAVIRQSGEALLAILNDVLDLSKIEAGKLELEVVEFELGDVLRGARSAYASLAERKGLGFVLDIDPAARGRYLGDPARLRQILHNLISNALKFTDQGEIRIAARRTGEMLELSVADTGIGISAENRAKLFGKFDQLDSSTTRRFGGTGLGLAISRELAELMGGDIRVETELGRGSCFTVQAPLPWLGEEQEAPAAERAVAAGRAAGRAAPGGLRVLAADDNAVNRLVLTTLLQQVGIEPVMVENGREAVEAWREGAWDVVLMDIQMPEMDGVAATAAIREEERRSGRRPTPIIALTANAMSHQVAEYLAAGMDGHVAKPIRAAELIEALDRAVSEPAVAG